MPYKHWTQVLTCSDLPYCRMLWFFPHVRYRVKTNVYRNKLHFSHILLSFLQDLQFRDCLSESIYFLPLNIYISIQINSFCLHPQLKLTNALFPTFLILFEIRSVTCHKCMLMLWNSRDIKLKFRYFVLNDFHVSLRFRFSTGNMDGSSVTLVYPKGR